MPGSSLPRLDWLTIRRLHIGRIASTMRASALHWTLLAAVIAASLLGETGASAAQELPPYGAARTDKFRSLPQTPRFARGPSGMRLLQPVRPRALRQRPTRKGRFLQLGKTDRQPRNPRYQ
jgi:hypothetical protein